MISQFFILCITNIFLYLLCAHILSFIAFSLGSHWFPGFRSMMSCRFWSWFFSTVYHDIIKQLSITGEEWCNYYFCSPSLWLNTSPQRHLRDIKYTIPKYTINTGPNQNIPPVHGHWAPCLTWCHCPVGFIKVKQYLFPFYIPYKPTQSSPQLNLKVWIALSWTNAETSLVSASCLQYIHVL